MTEIVKTEKSVSNHAEGGGIITFVSFGADGMCLIETYIQSADAKDANVYLARHREHILEKTTLSSTHRTSLKVNQRNHRTYKTEGKTRYQDYHDAYDMAFTTTSTPDEETDRLLRVHFANIAWGEKETAIKSKKDA